jgi:hypothetical protein
MRTRRTTVALLEEADAVSAFAWTPHHAGYGEHALGLAVFPDEPAARAAWHLYRRAVWAHCDRGRVPETATIYDGITDTAAAACWPDDTGRIDLGAVRHAIAADRVALERFRRMNPDGAAQIADYLALWAADLIAYESLAQEWTPESDRRPIVHQGRYGTPTASVETIQ